MPSGTRAFDWIVPEEWTIRDAYIADELGKRVIDFRASNLHVLGYSEPVDQWVTLDELQPHLYSLPEQPDAIPYVTSYYKRRWGFCLTHKQRQSLAPGRYRVVVDSTLEPGVLNYGELLLPGAERSEVLLSTYVCHPSMANNELSGPVVTAALVRWLMGLPHRRHSYRIVFLPETIGSIMYLSRNLAEMKERMVRRLCHDLRRRRAHPFLPALAPGWHAGRPRRHPCARPIWSVTISATPSSTVAVMSVNIASPGVDLPVCSVMRSKYGEYAEYHTSLDDLSPHHAEGVWPAGSKRCAAAWRSSKRIASGVRPFNANLNWASAGSIPRSGPRTADCRCAQ